MLARFRSISLVKSSSLRLSLSPGTCFPGSLSHLLSTAASRRKSERRSTFEGSSLRVKFSRRSTTLRVPTPALASAGSGQQPTDGTTYTFRDVLEDCRELFGLDTTATYNLVDENKRQLPLSAKVAEVFAAAAPDSVPTVKIVAAKTPATGRAAKTSGGRASGVGRAATETLREPIVPSADEPSVAAAQPAVGERPAATSGKTSPRRATASRRSRAAELPTAAADDVLPSASAARASHPDAPTVASALASAVGSEHVEPPGPSSASLPPASERAVPRAKRPTPPTDASVGRRTAASAEESPARSPPERTDGPSALPPDVDASAGGRPTRDATAASPASEQLMRMVHSVLESDWFEEELDETFPDATDAELETALRRFFRYVETFPPSDLVRASEDSDKANRQFFQAVFDHFADFVGLKLAQTSEPSRLRAKQITDLRRPHEWYPRARQFGRRIIMHVGPTNSGKTHQALRALTTAASGVYCAPLRLLAQEVHHRLVDPPPPAEGQEPASPVACDLLTGQQRILVPNSTHVSCTVEMANLDRPFDVAVIDEIQMIGSPDRGWAWTRALLGLTAKEVHLCGDESAMGVVKAMCDATGEPFEVHRYQRLSPLVHNARNGVLRRGWKGLSKGDAVIAFSRRKIYEIKAEIERQTGLRCCVVYGNLPPESRTHQAATFNDPDSGFDVLVASDAIGMGLNLNIKRVIFSDIRKFDGVEMRQLNTTEIKQIAGRAGRYRSVFPEGEVLSLDPEDVAAIGKALRSPVVPLSAAGLFPTYEQLAQFARHIEAEHIRFDRLLDKFLDICTHDPRFFVCDNESIKEIAKTIADLPLTLEERYTFCLSPVDKNNDDALIMLRHYAEDYARGHVVRPRARLPPARHGGYDPNYLQMLETVHNMMDLYLWLSLRFTDQFVEVEKASAIRNEAVDVISETLQSMTATELRAFASFKRGRMEQSARQRGERREGRRERSRDKQLGQQQHRQQAVAFAEEMLALERSRTGKKQKKKLMKKLLRKYNGGVGRSTDVPPGGWSFEERDEEDE